MTSARGKLREAEKRHGALLSVGLEPAPEYLPEGFPPTIAGYRQFLTAIVTATRDIAAAYKFNLAFFESLGPDGWQLLHDIRAILPDNALIVADAKRGDIGSTAKHYARAVYEHLAQTR
jgi:orotidine-5'-phosphate decarboxylase